MFIITLVVLLFTVLFLSGCSSAKAEDITAFASCLAEKEATLYGADWCPHCQQQKEMFGASFAKVNYVECTVDKQKCNEAQIQGFPTWKFADGSSLPGVQEFSILAEKTGCVLS